MTVLWLVAAGHIDIQHLKGLELHVYQTASQFKHWRLSRADSDPTNEARLVVLCRWHNTKYITRTDDTVNTHKLFSWDNSVLLQEPDMLCDRSIPQQKLLNPVPFCGWH